MNGCHKTISLIMSVVIAVTGFSYLSDRIFSANSSTDFQISGTTTAKKLPVELTDWSGIEDGSGKDGDTPRTYYTDMSGVERDAICPKISEAGQGVGESYALLLGGESKAVTRYETSLDFSVKGALYRKAKHTVKLKIRLLSGSADVIKLGLRETNTDEYKLAIPGSDLNGEWQEFSFEYTTGMQCKNYTSRLLISFTAPDGGAAILVDDIAVYLNSDENCKNIFGNGSFDVTFLQENFTPSVLEEGMVYSPYGIETLNHQFLFGFDGNYDAEISTLSVAEKAGTADSYALQLTGDGKSHQIFLKFPSTGALSNETEYSLGFNVKKSGEINKLAFEICEQWNVHRFLSFDKAAAQEYIADSYRFYSTSYITTSECKGAWNYIVIAYDLPTGAEVCIDDIILYRTDDTEKVNLYEKGTFDFTFYSQPVDNTPIKNAVYQQLALSEYNPVSNYMASDPGYALMNHENVSIVKAGGVKASCAMRLAGNGGALRSFIRLGDGVGYLKDNTEYMLAVKLRKSGSGKVQSFKLGYSTAWKDYNVFDYGDEAFRDSYVYYGAKFTTPDVCHANWQHLWLSFSADSGTDLYVDDIILYRTDDSTRFNLFQKGCFDSLYYSRDFDNTHGTENYVSYNLKKYTSLGHFFGFDDKDTANAACLSIVDGVGVKKSSAFRITGDGKKHRLMFRVNILGGLENNSDYLLGLKIRSGESVPGEKSFSVSVTEQWNTHSALILNGNDFESGITEQYRYYQIPYTTTAEGFSAWSYMTLDYLLPEGEEIYLDDLEIIPAGENNCWLYDSNSNPLSILQDGSFDTVDNGQDIAHWCNAPDGQSGRLSSYYNHNIADDSLGADLGICSDAISGNYCLKMGFDPETESNSEFMQNLTPSKPGKTYKVSFWVKVCGPVDGASFSIVDGRWRTHTYPISLNQYSQGKWTKIEFLYRDHTDKYSSITYRYTSIKLKAPKGSGMLLDNISFTLLDDQYEMPDFLGDGLGSFEQYDAYPQVSWSDRYTNKKGK